MATIPVPVTAELMARGRERYNISCLPCHGAIGDGNGITKKIGAMPVVANLLDKNAIIIPDGQVYDIIANGKAPNMQGLRRQYRSQRPLGHSRLRPRPAARALCDLDEVPATDRATLK